jgi:hypothetical protein
LSRRSFDEPKTLFITESNFRDEASIFDLSDSVLPEDVGAAFAQQRASNGRRGRWRQQ